MQTKITIRNEAQTCYIDIEGTIGIPEENQFEDASSRVATFEAFRREVKRITEVAAKSVVVNIRSTGGDVNDALLIYDALRALDARITTRCYGYTASAATIIAQAADEGCREISANALYLIHNSTCSIDGNSSSLDARAELLRKTDEQLANLYALHSGGDAATYAELMAENNGEGRWLTADEAIEFGLADCLIDHDEEPMPLEEGAEGDEQTTGKESGLPSDRALKRASATRSTVEAETTWSSIIRFLLDRLVERIDEWIEQIRDKREQKKKAKEEKKRLEEQQKQQEQGGENPSEEPASAEESGEESAAAEGTDPKSSEQPQLPKASAMPTPMIFSERQRSFAASRVMPTEDPSSTATAHYANSQAYADDVKAFGR